MLFRSLIAVILAACKQGLSVGLRPACANKRTEKMHSLRHITGFTKSRKVLTSDTVSTFWKAAVSNVCLFELELCLSSVRRYSTVPHYCLSTARKQDS